MNAKLTLFNKKGLFLLVEQALLAAVKKISTTYSRRQAQKQAFTAS